MAQRNLKIWMIIVVMAVGQAGSSSTRKNATYIHTGLGRTTVGVAALSSLFISYVNKIPQFQKN